MSQEAQARKEIETALIAKAHADAAFREALLTDTKATIERELGYKLPARTECQVLEETGSTCYLVLPAATDGELSDSELESVAGGTGKAVSRVKTSDKQQKAVMDFVKG